MGGMNEREGMTEEERMNWRLPPKFKFAQIEEEGGHEPDDGCAKEVAIIDGRPAFIVHTREGDAA